MVKVTNFEIHIIKDANVDNVTQVTSTNPWQPILSFSETFTYDASDQLTTASETQNRSYTLSVSYDNWGKMENYDILYTDLLNSTTTQDNRTFSYPAANSLQDAQTLFAPEQCAGTTDVAFTFGINGSLRRREVSNPQPYTEYYLFNNAANLKAYSNNGLDFAYYGYNAANTRTYKLSMLNQNQWVNGQPQPLNLQLQSAMFYPNAYINFNQNGEYTKHYYNGAERIASRLGTVTLNIATTANARLNTRSVQLEDCFRNDIRTLVYAGDIPMDLPPEPVSATSLQQTGTPDDIFYYHTNHLGSTAFVTDNNATITHGVLYAPFGETTTEYNANFGNNVLPKYSFNAKELDEETGMYYYEARYYKPPVFTSRDAMFEKYFWMSPYAYCANNPVKYVDPSGEEAWKPDGNGGWIAQKNDNAWTLHKDAGISFEKAKSLMKEQGFVFSNDDKHVRVQIGDRVQVDSHKEPVNISSSDPSTKTSESSLSSPTSLPIYITVGGVIKENISLIGATISNSALAVIGFCSILLQGDTRSDQTLVMSHGINNIRLENKERELLKAKKKAGTLTSEEKLKLKTDEKATGIRKSRPRKDKKKR